MDKVIIGDQYTFIFVLQDMFDHARSKHNGDQVVVLGVYRTPDLWQVQSKRTGLKFDAHRAELDLPEYMP